MRNDNYEIRRRNERSPARALARELLPILSRLTPAKVLSTAHNPWTHDHDLALLRAVLEVGPALAAERVRRVRPEATHSTCKDRIRKLARLYATPSSRQPQTGGGWFEEAQA
jgi:hypothetical protein